MSKENFSGKPIVLGAVVRVHGLKGALRVRSFAESPRSFEAAERVLLLPQEGPEQWKTVEWIRPHPKGLLLKLNGVDSPEEAGFLVGAEIGLDRCDLPEPEEGEFFWADLIGLQVLTSTGKRIGRVADMFETGANDVMVVRGNRDEVLIPAVEAAVERIDLDSGEITLSDLPGLVPEEETSGGSGTEEGTV